MDVIFKTENGTESLQPPEGQKKLETEKLNKPDGTVYKDNKEKMDQGKKFDMTMNKPEDTKYRAGMKKKKKQPDETVYNDDKENMG